MAIFFHLIHNLEPIWSQIGLEPVYSTKEIIFELQYVKYNRSYKEIQKRGENCTFGTQMKMSLEMSLRFALRFLTAKAERKSGSRMGLLLSDKCNV